MADIVSKSLRSRMMAGIRTKNTNPELVVRKLLFKHGFRYRLHDKSLPGKPDIVLRKHNAAVFVHGCFWHSHWCPLFKWPSSNTTFWREKLTGNKERDSQKKAVLNSIGWRVCTIWECSLRGKPSQQLFELGETLFGWLHSSDVNLEVPSRGQKM